MGDLLSAAGAEVSVIPVVQGDGMPKVELSQLPDMIPILALRNAVLFPGTVFPITIGREMSIRLIEDAEKNNMFIGAVPQNDLSVEEPQMEDLYPYGTVAKIIKTLEMPDGTITAILQGYRRFGVEAIVQYEPYMLGRVHYLEDFTPDYDTNTKMIAETLKEKAAAVIRSSSMAPREAVSALKGIDNFEFLVNFVATTIEVENYMEKVELLQYSDLKARAMKLLSVLDTQVELQKIKQEINQKVKTEIDQQQREYYLNNQLKTIQEELGMDDVEEFAQLRARALFKHRKRRLLAANFCRNLPLGQPRLAASQLDVFAELWIQVFQGGDIMDFILSTFKGAFINIINIVINSYQQVYQLINSC